MDRNVKKGTVKVWDPLVRIFHWSLALFFILAFVTEDEWMSLHSQAGYAISLLIGFRLLWGVIGTPAARFSKFVRSPATVLSHLGQMLRGTPPHYLGHNPLASVMVLALLLGLALTSFSGMVVFAAEGQGPLTDTLFARWRADWVEELHELLANFTLLLVFLHVAGVVVSSFLEGENLVRAMITGRKRKREAWADFDAEEVS